MSENSWVEKQCRRLVSLYDEQPGIRIVIATDCEEWMNETLVPCLSAVIRDSSSTCLLDDDRMKVRGDNGSVIDLKIYTDADEIKGWEAHVIWFHAEHCGLEMQSISSSLHTRLRCGVPAYPTMFIESYWGSV